MQSSPPSELSAVSAAPPPTTRGRSLESEELQSALRASEEAARWEALRTRLGMPRRPVEAGSAARDALPVLTPMPSLVSMGAAWLNSNAPVQRAENEDGAPQSLCRAHAVRRIRSLATESSANSGWLTLGVLVGLLEDYRSVAVEVVAKQRREKVSEQQQEEKEEEEEKEEKEEEEEEEEKEAKEEKEEKEAKEEKEEKEEPQQKEEMEKVEEKEEEAPAETLGDAAPAPTPLPPLVDVPRFLHAANAPWRLRVGEVDALVADYASLVRAL